MIQNSPKVNSTFLLDGKVHSLKYHFDKMLGVQSSLDLQIPVASKISSTSVQKFVR